MFLAEEASQTATAATSNFNVFDIFMLVFTVLIFIGFVRLVLQRPTKNKFAIGFTFVSLLVFLFADYVMIFKVWLA